MDRNEQILVLEMCRRALIQDCGTLADLPYELANTIANVYYRFFALEYEPEPSFTSIEDSIANVSERARILADHHFAPKIVTALRQMIKEAHPSYVEAFAEMFVCQLKYRIDDAPEKSLARLKVERFLKRPAAKEFPGLGDVLGLR